MTLHQFLPALMAVGWALKSPEDLKYLWRKPTDWDAARERLGYERAPSRPTVERPPEWRAYRYVLGFWPVLDFDAERKRLGYDQ